MQNIFSNLVSGILILIEKTLKVGDFVDLQSGVVGNVTEIGLRYTRVTTNDNVDVIVPNSEFINGRVTNWTLDDNLRRIHVPFGVAYGSSKDAVRDAVTAAARRVSGTIDQPGQVPEVWLVSFGERAVSTSNWWSGSVRNWPCRQGERTPATGGRSKPRSPPPGSRFPSRSATCTYARDG